jgi:3,4-dihydroxy 2-butanone 4-phosphate synthase/GTP cyclohydrolase II
MFSTIDIALRHFEKGEPIIVVDDESRENEGDIIFPADCSTQEKMNLCAKEARGLICIAIDQSIAKRLDIKPMSSNQKDLFHTAFHDSIDASSVFGITTGISAKERSITAKHIASNQSKPEDFIKPGHLFPVVAKQHGILVRTGHTEAAVDLCKLTKHAPAAIICEIMNEEGDMMRRDGLFSFAQKHSLPIITIQQIVDYRNANENPVQLISSSNLPTEFGEFEIKVFKNTINNKEHIVLLNNESTDKKPIVRLHSECLTGDVFGSQRCDCQSQLHYALAKIASNKSGCLIYLKGHEGRGIGIANKISAYHLQEQGFNTYEANKKLGLAEDDRNYQEAIWILKKLSIDNFELITNNPLKSKSLKLAGFNFEILQVEATISNHNINYLKDKIAIGNHSIKLPL